MYNVILVDDEAPALRFLQAIVAKYAPDFTLTASFQSGEEALAYLSDHRADLLITDISMPGMDGIALAKAARMLYPQIRIVIVSGYAEFEYAQGAIQAAVDDYILKPVTIAHMTATLDRVKSKLDEVSVKQEPALLGALLTGQPYDRELLEQLFGGGGYYFAFVRWGNLTSITDDELIDTMPIHLQGEQFHALRGRCKDEQILYMKQEAPASHFQSAVKAYVSQRQAVATWTIIFSNSAAPFTTLSHFVRRAEKLLSEVVVIGRRQFMLLSSIKCGAEKPHIAKATLKKLDCFCQSDNKKYIKDLIITLATDWEKHQVPQLHVYHMTQQLIHIILPYRQSLALKQDAI